MAKGTLRVNGVLVASEIHKIVQESGTGSGGGTGVGDEILLETGLHILTEVSETAAIQAQTGDNIVIREDDGSAVLTVDTSGVATFTGNVNVGTDDVGHDVKFHGATAGSYMLWDESTDHLIVGGAGQIGIGTTAPVTALHVNGTGGGIVSAIMVEDSNATSNQRRFRLYSSSQKAYFDIPNDAFNSATDVMAVDLSNGRVGIGTDILHPYLMFGEQFKLV